MKRRTTSGAPLGFWLRWSWRDLRGHWVGVVAIALVLAIGTGVYAGLSSTGTWRRESNDASFGLVGTHDLRVELSPGTFVPAGRLTALLDGVDGVDRSNERLVVDNQLETTSPEGPVLVYTRLVGMPFGTVTHGGDVIGGPVDAVWLRDGGAPDADQPAPQGILEAKFANERGLPPTGTVTLAGNRDVTYTGRGFGPEEFYVTGPEGMIFAEGEAATLYVPTAVAGDLVGRPGQVNDLVLTLRPGTDRDVVQARLEDAVTAAGIGATVTTRDDIEAYTVLYEDIDSDQQFWNALSALVLLAAGLAAFNLVNRIVEAQRREIGIGMALGVRRRRLALRPLLIGTQIALLGTLLGVAVGVVIGQAMGDLLRTILPLPDYRTPFQFGVFARAAVIALVIPVLASAVPVWRAVRVEPIRAIRTGHLAARTSTLTDWTNRVRIPGSTLTQMPVRNVLRTPRRTVLTAVGVGAAITALVGTLGMLDSFTRTVDQGVQEMTGDAPDRVVVQLDTFYPAGGPPVTDIAAAPSVGRTDPGIRLPATISSADADESFDILLELVDLDTARWTPSIDDAVTVPAGGAGIILAPKAAADLHVGTGDTVTVRHLVVGSGGALSLVDSNFVVAGLDRNPIRTFAYADMSIADRFGLAGAANVVHTYPAAGATSNEVQRDVFSIPGVASSQSVARVSQVFDDAVAQFVGFLVIAALAMLVLALLIAFNATRITVEERRREHATMRAFGLPVRSIVGVVVKESVVIGILATVIGVVGGTLFLQWMLDSLARRTLPDIGIETYVSPTTVLVAALVGIVAVALAPLFLIGRIRRMNVPDTLRVME